MNKEFILKFKNICSIFLNGLAKNPLFAIVFLFLIILTLGAYIFYRYDVLVKASQPKTAAEIVQFKKGIYQQVLIEWQKRDQRFESVDSLKYIDPFQEKRENPALSSPEPVESVSVDPKLLGARTLQEFYAFMGEKTPLLNSRAKMWQEFGLGSLSSYIGSNAQNKLLLAELKKRLTE